MKRALLSIVFLLSFGVYALQANMMHTNDPATVQGEIITLGQNYPNPAVDKTYITFKFTEAEGTLTVFNVLGKMIETRKVSGNQIELDVSNYKEGVYLYTLEVDGQKMTKRMTVKRH